MAMPVRRRPPGAACLGGLHDGLPVAGFAVLQVDGEGPVVAFLDASRVDELAGFADGAGHERGAVAADDEDAVLARWWALALMRRGSVGPRTRLPGPRPRRV